jgi:GNAT superfamily N-acetyltransferase
MGGPGSGASTGPSATLRRATGADAVAVADLYLRSFRATYDFPLAHTDDDVREWVRTRLVPQMETWVALGTGAAGEGPERVLGFATVEPGWLEQLYVDPDHLGEGIGRQLLEKAKERQPDGLLLWTFQVNERARRFYERNGFTVVRFGDASNNEEGQPDVQYAWLPDRPGA